MNTQPTPVSDLIIKQFRAGEAHSDGLILTLRDMELNLTAALAEIDRLDVAGIHSCHANCQKSMCVMRRELTAVTEQRDELAESLDFQIKLNRECIDQITTRTKERDEAREQRDGLAEALRMITTFDYTDLQCDNGYGPRSIATEALQSLNQPTEP